MIAKISIPIPQKTIEAEYVNDEIQFELWEDDNVIIRRNEFDGKLPDFVYEISKEHAIKLAKQILGFYNAP
jgi:hypothetical protein